MKLNEEQLEQVTIEIFQELGYEYKFGPEIAPDSDTPLRAKWDDVILTPNLQEAIKRLNPQLSKENIEEVTKKIKRLNDKEFLSSNVKFHKYLTEGVPLEYRSKGKIVNDTIKLIDYENINKNEFLVINQFTIIQDNHNRRPDLIVFINGLPIGLIELKNPTDEKTSLESAYKQIETYKTEIQNLLCYNEIIILSDGTFASAGTLTSTREWYLPWKTVNGKQITNISQIEVLVKGMFQKEKILDLIKYFITFSTSRKKTIKLIAGYHQYDATNEAVTKTLSAINKSKKIGIVWHTQGSGKSLTLAFYTGKLQQQEKLNNPTIVILTDRNDLDDQLFNTFSGIECLREKPVQATSKEKLKELLRRASGGIIFTTIQKFGTEEGKLEILSDRSNIIVAADEAHRTQYGFKAKVTNDQIKYGLAKYLRDALPNASFIGFTGTPIDFEDRSTRNVFGDYIHVYDIEQAVNDERTVKIYYESRLAKLNITQELAKLDKEFDEVTESEEIENKNKLKGEWSRLESIVGSDNRIKQIAKDIVNHFEQRNNVMGGKGMIVCMSRRICVQLYNEIQKIKPEWANNEDDKGLLKVIMTGSAADGPEWQQHIRNKERRKHLADTFKDTNSEFKLAIVRDMWLTGFDAPSLHTLYVDKPMKGHGLMQAIARVNRVFENKEGGLIVDYLGIAQELKFALGNYTKSGGKGSPTYDMQDAINLMNEKFEIVSALFHGFDYNKFFTGSTRERINVIPGAMDHILSIQNGKKRFLTEMSGLTSAQNLSIPSEDYNKLRDKIAFFQAVKASLIKNTEIKNSGKTDYELQQAVKQLVSSAIGTEGIVDIFETLGYKRPELSNLTDDFLDEMKDVKYKNLAVEALRKLLSEEIKMKFKGNGIKERKFSEMLNEAIKKYLNRSLDSAEVLLNLIEIAKEIRNDKSKGVELGLNKEEEAFYDALADNESARKILGDETLKEISKELTKTVRNNTSIDWTLRKSVQDKLKVMVKRLLRKYGYPPDKQKMATDLVLDQAKLLADEWAE